MSPFQDRASILINIAGTLQLQKKYQQSLPLYVEAIGILIETLGLLSGCRLVRVLILP